MESAPDRLEVPLTAGAIRNDYVSLRGRLDFFPSESIGGDTDADEGRRLRLDVDGVGGIETDINGPKQRFRARGIFSRFFAHHELQEGDAVEIRRLAEFEYRVTAAPTVGSSKLSGLSSPGAVLEAMQEYDDIGRGPFLDKHGFGPATQYMAVNGDRLYDPKATAGAAFSIQFPHKTPLQPSDFVGGISAGAVGPKLGSLGFPVVDTGDLGPSSARALVDIRDGRAPYNSREAVTAQDLIPLLEHGLVLETDGDAGLALTPHGEDALAQILAKAAGGGLVLPQTEVDAFAATLETAEYKGNERDYKVALHLALNSLLAADQLNDPGFPKMLGAFFDRRLDLDQLDLAEADRTFIEDAVRAPQGLTDALANLCGGGFGVNNYIWIPGAIRDGLGDEVAQVFADLVTSEAPVADRVDGFRSALVEVEQKAQELPSWRANWTIVRPSTSFAAALLGALDPHRFSFYLQGKLKPPYEELVGEWPSGTVGQIYEQVVRFVKEVRDALVRQGAPVRDLIDAQSFLYLRGGGTLTATEALAASIETFRAEYPYNENEKTERDETALALRKKWRPGLTEEALAAPDWVLIDELIASTYHGNLGPAKTKPLNLIASGSDEKRSRFAEAIRNLLHGDADLVVSLDRFLSADLSGIKETVAMKLLSVQFPDRILPIFKVHGKNGKAELMQRYPVSLDVPEAESPAELAIKANDAILGRLAPFFGTDAYGMNRYLYWLADQEAEASGEGVEEADTSLESLSESLYLDDSGWLEDAVDLLGRKRQLILYGPPGTGKTYVALRLIEHLAPSAGQREIVQFHPSYSYEDFVRGYRPVDQTGVLSYEVVQGPLLRLAERARASMEDDDPKPYILLIDEINRGNLPRILGELLYLLEYRSETDGVQLMYGGEGEAPFTLPENLWIVGTMNTADRSIGLIDAALRRRFHFKALFPGEPPIKGTLRRWLHSEGPAEIANVAADQVDQLNERLMEQQGAYGENLKVGHSYFMEHDLDVDLLSRIWASDVLPYLEEQLFGREVDIEGTFSLEALSSDVGSGPAPTSEPDNGSTGDETDSLLDDSAET